MVRVFPYLRRHFVLFLFFSVEGIRSPHRPHDSTLPEIITSWPGSSEKFILRNSHLEEVALFKKFDKAFFLEHQFPDNSITLRNDPSCTVSGTHIKELLEKLLRELRECVTKRTNFEDFTVLKCRDFNFKLCCGLIVLKFKNYPFVIKLFIEIPSSFVRPFSKGFEPIFFFVMGGGINRYMSGFTRVKNLEAIRLHIKNDPYWSEHIDLPRKWFWEPKDNKWFLLEGNNIGCVSHQSILLPSVYGIMCDEIKSDGSLRLINKANRRLGIRLSQFLGNRVDPHIDNFMIECETRKIVLVDTEHFPTMVGLKEPLYFDGYFEWYRKLIHKFLKDCYCRTKRERKAIHLRPIPEIACC